MTDSDLNFLVAVIGCLLATFWVIGQIWLATVGRRLSSSPGASAVVAVRPAAVAAGRLRGLSMHENELGATSNDNAPAASRGPSAGK